MQKLEDLDFADYLVLLSQKFELLQEQAARVGLKVNATSTKEVRIRPSPNTGNISSAG